MRVSKVGWERAVERRGHGEKVCRIDSLKRRRVTKNETEEEESFG